MRSPIGGSGLALPVTPRARYVTHSTSSARGRTSGLGQSANLVCLSVHSFLDGIAIGIGVQAGSELGVVIAFAVIAHDFSDGLNTVNVVLAHGNPLRRSVMWLLIDMTTPMLGAATTLLFTIPQSLLPWVLAFFCGFFLYIGASDLLPEAQQHDSPMVGVATAAGMLLIFVVTRFLPR